jgi:hypothetical protein
MMLFTLRRTKSAFVTLTLASLRQSAHVQTKRALISMAPDKQTGAVQ